MKQRLLETFNKLKTSFLLFIEIAIMFSISVFAQQKSIIKGVILDYNGKPLPKAHASFEPAGTIFHTIHIDADSVGSFSIELNQLGGYWLTFNGVNHLECRAKLFIRKPSEIYCTVRLSPYKYLDTLKDVYVIGNFNLFDFKTGIKMKKGSDGKYTCNIKTDSNQLKYQLVGLLEVKRSVNGTQAEHYELDSGGDYISIVTPRKGMVHLVFDPSKLIRSDSRPSIKFNDPLNNLMKELDAERDSVDKKQEIHALAYIKNKMDPKAYYFDVSSIVNKYSSKIESEKDTLIRQLLLIHSFSLQQFNFKQKDSSVIKEWFEHINPSSRLFELYSDVLRSLLYRCGSDIMFNSYLERYLQSESSIEAKASLLAVLMGDLACQPDSTKLRNYYTRFMKDFPNSDQAGYVRMKLNPDPKIRIGKNVPSFSIPSLDDSTKIISNTSLIGKTYLIHFWFTGISNFLSEIIEMQSLYKKYKHKGFEIVSLSFDDTPNIVRDFRRTRFKMPWLHAWLPGMFGDPIAKQFDIALIPNKILVDASGKIVATEDNLRGNQLRVEVGYTLSLKK